MPKVLGIAKGVLSTQAKMLCFCFFVMELHQCRQWSEHSSWGLAGGLVMSSDCCSGKAVANRLAEGAARGFLTLRVCKAAALDVWVLYPLLYLGQIRRYLGKGPTMPRAVDADADADADSSGLHSPANNTCECVAVM